MNTMKKRFISTTAGISSSSSVTLTSNIINFSDSISDSILNKSIKDIFNTSKLYHKYLSTVNTKITNSINMDETNVKNFNEYYENANIIYEEIKKEWFWLSNGDKMKQFINKSESMESHKQNYYNNFQMLEVITKMYGFDSWSTTQKNKLLQQTSSNESTFEEKIGQMNL